MVDTLALGASAARRGGSSPLSRTKVITLGLTRVITLVHGFEYSRSDLQSKYDKREGSHSETRKRKREAFSFSLERRRL